MELSPTQFSFLADRSEETYLQNILRYSVESTKRAITDSKKLIEIEFLPTRRNDISVTETLDINRDFTRKLARSFEKDYGRSLWIVFPDSKEAALARDSYGERELPFHLTSLDQLSTTKQAAIEPPALVLVVNPGFNVEEWIELARNELLREAGSTVIVVNGNLDRLRNGYYPGIFYPTLAKVSKSYYSEVSFNS
jgi:hypothetical protein